MAVGWLLAAMILQKDCSWPVALPEFGARVMEAHFLDQFLWNNRVVRQRGKTASVRPAFVAKRSEPEICPDLIDDLDEIPRRNFVRVKARNKNRHVDHRKISKELPVFTAGD